MAEDRKQTRKGPGDPATQQVDRDAKSRIQQLSRVLGNDEIAKRISGGNATRDQMLAFVTERLGVVQELQKRELTLTLKGADFGMPHHLDARDLARPTRWHETATAYREAVDAVCRGDLRRGQDLLERAQRVEQQTLSELSSLVDTGEAWREGTLDPGVLAAMVAQAPVSGACAEPTEVKSRLDAILAVTQTVPDRATPRRELDPWWTLEDEEEEEGDGDG
ncbi:MAG: hypothetical protein ABMA64_10005 [Myxococcota bacterium]